MGLEAASYIDGLVATNPTTGDGMAQGDDHLRLLKSVLKASFPAVSGAVTPTHTELNYVDGVTSAIQTQLNNLGALVQGFSWTEKSANYTASSSDGVLTDTTGGAWTLTLPASPTVGARVYVIDAGSSWATNNLTIGRNGEKIMELEEDLVCDWDDASFMLVYSGSTFGWRLV